MKRCFGRSLAWVLLALLGLGGAPSYGAKAPVPRKSRIVTVQDARAMTVYETHNQLVQNMLNRALLKLTGSNSLATAWHSLVSTQDVVGLKVFSVPGPHSGTRPAVVEAVVRGLLASGIPARNIIIWDKHYADLKLAGFVELAQNLGVRLAAAETGYDETAFYEKPLMGNLVFGDLEFGKKGEGIGKKSFLTRLVSQEITKIISIAPLINHNLAGVSGHIYGVAMGSVDNTLRFESTRERLNEAAPEILALPQLYDRLALCITDALVCQYQGELRGLLHYSVVMNELRLSKDPVALDTLSMLELDAQREKRGFQRDLPNLDLVNNASLLELGASEPRNIVVEKLDAEAR